MVAASIQFFACREHGTSAPVDRNKFSSQGVLIQSMDAKEKDSVQRHASSGTGPLENYLGRLGKGPAKLESGIRSHSEVLEVRPEIVSFCETSPPTNLIRKAPRVHGSKVAASTTTFGSFGKLMLRTVLDDFKTNL